MSKPLLSLAADPITENKSAVQAYLAQANTGALVMSIVHLTGDPSIIRGSLKPTILSPTEVASGEEPLDECGFTQKEAQLIREEALLAIETYQGNDFEVASINDSLVDEMLEFITGKKLGAAYSKFIKEEIALDGIDYRHITLDGRAAQMRASEFPTVIIGAGMGGILAAIRLAQAGMPYVIVEKNSGVGGTWFENHYPGCRVDVPGHSYTYSFEPNHDWECYFPLADDIRAYYERCASKFNVKQHIRFNTEVVEANYSDDLQEWQIHTRNPEGQTEVLHANVLVSAVGQLNRPKMPDIDGIEKFKGAIFHSADWQHNCDLQGKRVAIIGAGATAFQIIPEVAKQAGTLTAFQRKPSWMFPNPVYHEKVLAGHQWALKKIPFYSKWYRFLLFYSAVEGAYEQTRVDPNWQNPLSVSQSNDGMRQMLTAWISSQVQDAELLEKVVPRYPPFGTRILQDNGTYLAALQQENVSLCTSGIEKIVENGILSSDGQMHELDIIVCATGFHSTRFLFPMKITGRNGIELDKHWGKDNGRAYLGITVPNFPNLFCIYGPNTNLVVAGSIAHNAESQVNYIMRCLKLLLETDSVSMECQQVVHDEYNKKVDQLNATSAWGSEKIENWYKNSQGRVTANLPFRIIDYWKMTHVLNPDDFIIRSIEPH